MVGLCGLVLGCAPERHYRTLSFFLDGVPDPSAQEASPADPDAGLAPPRGGPTRSRPAGLTGSMHRPVAERECGACHKYYVEKPGTSAQGISLLTTYRPGETQSNLARPIRLLCVGCHTAYGPDTAAAEGLWLHGPVGAGACTFCHEQHDSPFRKLLRAAHPRDLCLQCHMAEDLQSNAEHPPIDEDDCTDCHNPHRGDSRLLL